MAAIPRYELERQDQDIAKLQAANAALKAGMTGTEVSDESLTLGELWSLVGMRKFCQQLMYLVERLEHNDLILEKSGDQVEERDERIQALEAKKTASEAELAQL